MAHRLSRRFTLRMLLVAMAIIGVGLAAWIRYSKCNEPSIEAQIVAWQGWIADLEQKANDLRQREKLARSERHLKEAASFQSRVEIVEGRIARARSSLRTQEDLCRSRRWDRWNPFAGRPSD